MLTQDDAMKGLAFRIAKRCKNIALYCAEVSMNSTSKIAVKRLSNYPVHGVKRYYL